MLKLYERLPDSVTVKGKSYRLDLDFRNVLEMAEVLAREDLTDEARVFTALSCVMKRPPAENAGEILLAVREMLFTGGKEPEGKRLTDFDQDADYIRAAFLQVYGIDLWRDKLHYLAFTGYLSALPEGNRYSEILGIRARTVPAPTKYNRAEREWLMKAKARYALEIDEKEQARNYERSVTDLFNGLLTLARKGK